jgi:hypothetical protein
VVKERVEAMVKNSDVPLDTKFLNTLNLNLSNSVPKELYESATDGVKQQVQMYCEEQRKKADLHFKMKIDPMLEEDVASSPEDAEKRRVEILQERSRFVIITLFLSHFDDDPISQMLFAEKFMEYPRPFTRL